MAKRAITFHAVPGQGDTYATVPPYDPFSGTVAACRMHARVHRASPVFIRDNTIVYPVATGKDRRAPSYRHIGRYQLRELPRDGEDE